MLNNRFFDSPDRMADDIIQGFSLVWNDYVKAAGHCIYYKQLETTEPRIGTMYLGGAGHEPGSLAFIGREWENLRVIGDIFAAPSAQTVLEGIRLLDKGKGVFLYCGNHEGDVMAARLAVRLAKREGREVSLFIIRDDCSVFGRDEMDSRRHVCSGPLLSKMIGAAVSKGYTMQELMEIGDKFTRNVSAISVASKGAHHPITGRLLTDIPDGKMVIGMGHHGEGSQQQQDLLSSVETVRIMVGKIIADLGLEAGDQVAIMLNGSGGLSYMELMIAYRNIVDCLGDLGISIYFKLAGSFTTTMDQIGFGIGLLRLDGEMQELISAPCKTPFYTFA